MLIARTLPELQDALATLAPRSVGFAPTMGALHQGHLSLLRAAQRDGLTGVASIFVNPLQFGPSEDFSRYPRDEAADLAALEKTGCAIAWLPDVATVYPPDSATSIEVEGPARGFEGAQRPGHFRGVATVVARLFGQIKPNRAYFGEKDWQQLQVVTRMVADLALPVKIVAVPTFREPDGLAMSSRNRYLSPAHRALAPILYATLLETADRLRAGQHDALTTASAKLAGEGFAPDYLALVDGPSMVPVTSIGTNCRLIAAARLGDTRLLDNIAV